MVKLLVGTQVLAMGGLVTSLAFMQKEKGKIRSLQKNAMDIIGYVHGRVQDVLRMTETAEVEEEKISTREEVIVTPDDHVKVQQLLRKAEKALDEEDFEEVERICIEALALNPDDEDVNTTLAYVYRKQDKLSKAESIYVHLIEEGNQDPAIFSGLGRVLEDQNRTEMALRAYSEALKRDPHNAARHATLAQMYGKTGATREAIEAYEQALRYDSKNTEYMFALVEAYMQVDALMMATKYLDAILYNEPYNEKAKAMLLGIKEQGKI